MDKDIVLRRLNIIKRAFMSLFDDLGIKDEELVSMFKIGTADRRSFIGRFGKKTPIIYSVMSEDKDSAVRYFRQNFPAEHRATLDTANDICGGRLALLGHSFADSGSIDWYLEPFSKTHYKKTYWRFLKSRKGQDIMFTYELHKHQYLVTLAKAYWLTNDEKYAEAAVSIMEDWMAKNKAEAGPAYTSTLNVSQRMISWLLSWPFLSGYKGFSENFILDFIRTLCREARFITDYSAICWRPRNNFVIAESTALLLLSCFLPELNKAEGIRAGSIRVLQQELKKQVWPDGVSFEQSSGYQRLVMDLVFLAVIACHANNIDLPADIEDTLLRLCESLMNLTQPDGKVASIGDVSTEAGFKLSVDEDLESAKKYMSLAVMLFERPEFKYMAGFCTEDVFWFFGAQGVVDFYGMPAGLPQYGSKAFKEGGYFVMRNGWGEKAHQMIIDCGHTGLGEKGPGGHGHNDMLHFTLSTWGRPAVADAGTYLYFASRSWRDYFRSTFAHNTAVVDGEEISELARQPFRIRPQARPLLREWRPADEYDYFAGSHTGYSRLADPVRHERRILFADHAYWVVEDYFDGKKEHTVSILFHIHPSKTFFVDHGLYCAAPENSDEDGFMILPAAKEGCRMSIDKGWFSTRYGKKQAAQLLTFSMTRKLPFGFKIILFPFIGGHVYLPEKIRAEALKAWSTKIAKR